MKRGRGRSFAERFWSKVDRRGPEECWEWTAGRQSDGYGRFREGGRSSPNLGAHRVAYVLAHGPIVRGLWVLHKCDNPPCCNPAHLRLGTHEDNMRDMAEKGRSCTDQLGSKGHNAKLTEADVESIRIDAARGIQQKLLALKFHVSKGSISDIVNCKTWQHVPDVGAVIRAQRRAS